MDTNPKAVPVHSIEQEYVYLEKARCECGGRFQPVVQGLSMDLTDVTMAKCADCGQSRTFEFDISLFFRYGLDGARVAQWWDDPDVRIRQ